MKNLSCNDYRLYLLLIGCLCLAGCAGMTAAETTGVAVTGVGALVGFVEALRPMLDPAQAAKLTALAGNVESVTAAIGTALGQVAESVSALKAEQAAQWTPTQVTTGGVGLAGGAVAAARALSIAKHGFAGKAPKAAE